MVNQRKTPNTKDQKVQQQMMMTTQQFFNNNQNNIAGILSSLNSNQNSRMGGTKQRQQHRGVSNPVKFDQTMVMGFGDITNKIDSNYYNQRKASVRNQHDSSSTSKDYSMHPIG